jgi:hypothetical protein
MATCKHCHRTDAHYQANIGIFCGERCFFKYRIDKAEKILKNLSSPEYAERERLDFNSYLMGLDWPARELNIFANHAKEYFEDK